MKRKIIQIIMSPVHTIYALCEDGSMWAMYRGGGDMRWYRIENIPDDEVRNTA